MAPGFFLPQAPTVFTLFHNLDFGLIWVPHFTCFMVLPEHAVILLAEDSPDDVVLIKRALEEAHVKNPVLVVSDGEEALAYLEGAGKYSDRIRFPLPDIMLLDLKMPKVNGFDVLLAMRQRPELHNVRVLVLTSSEDIRDVNKAYELGASSFLVKPLEFQNFASLMRALNYFWLQRNAMPGPHTADLPSEASASKKSMAAN